MEECSENVDGAKSAGTALFEHGNVCVCSYTICVVLVVIALTALRPVLVLLINTSTVIKKKFLNMIMSIRQKIINLIKWKKLSK